MPEIYNYILQAALINGYDHIIYYAFENCDNAKACRSSYIIDNIKYGNLEMIKFLMEKRQQRFNNYTKRQMLLTACNYDKYEIVKYFIQDNFFDIDNINYAIGGYIQNLEIIKYLIVHGANINNCSMIEYIKKDNYDIVKYLIDNGFDIAKVPGHVIRKIYQFS